MACLDRAQERAVMELTLVDGKQLKTLRIGLKWSMQELHDKTGISILRIFEIEKSGKGTPKELFAIWETIQGEMKCREGQN